MNTHTDSIFRLLNYKNTVIRLKSLGFTKVFSDNIGDSTGVTASQVRKDFSFYGISGHRRGGYNIDELIKKFNEILGKEKIHNIIIVGVGNIGRALINYKGFEEEGIKIIAGFDIAHLKIDDKKDFLILPLQDLKEFVKKNDVKIGIITVPKVAAQQVLDIMIDAGIIGILNFAPIILTSTKNCIINNVNLVLELENLVYNIKLLEQNK